MDGNTVFIIVVIVFAIVAVAGLLLYRRRGEVSLEVGGAKVSVKGENEPKAEATSSQSKTDPGAPAPTPGVNVKRVESTAGGLYAQDETGRGANVEDAKTRDDIIVTSSNPDADPKA